MTDQSLIELMVKLFQLIGLIVAPVVVVVITVGLLVNIFQTVTQLKDQTLTFVPKVISALIVLALTGPWYLRLAKEFFVDIMERVARGGWK